MKYKQINEAQSLEMASTCNYECKYQLDNSLGDDVFSQGNSRGGGSDTDDYIKEPDTYIPKIHSLCFT